MAEMQTLGDYIKSLEAGETHRRAGFGQAVYIRIDGNRFSKFTRGMARPFDERMSRAMIETTKDLVRHFGAAHGYTQSDEISLVLWEPLPESELAHGGKFQKLASRTASHATHRFYRHSLENGMAEFVERQFPEFDSRAFACSYEEAMKAIRWREIDAMKNAVSMAARHHFSHKALQGKNRDDMLAMMAEKAIDFDVLPAFFRVGTHIERVTVLRELNAEELARIPEQHRPSGPIERTDLIEVCPVRPGDAGETK